MSSLAPQRPITVYAGIDIGSTLCKGALVIVRRDPGTGGIQTSEPDHIKVLPTSECMERGAAYHNRPVLIPQSIKMAIMSSSERQPFDGSAHLFATYESQWAAAAEHQSVAREMSLVVSTMLLRIHHKVASFKKKSPETRRRFEDAVALACQDHLVQLATVAFLTESVAAAHGVVGQNDYWRSNRAHGPRAILVIDGGGLTIDASVYVRRGPNAQAQKVYSEDSKLSGFLLIDSKFERCARQQVARFIVPGQDEHNERVENSVTEACNDWATNVRNKFPDQDALAFRRPVWKNITRGQLEDCFDETVLQAVNMVLPWFAATDHGLRPKLVVFAGGMWRTPYLRTTFQLVLNERLGRGPYPVFQDYQLDEAIMTVAYGAAIWGASPL